MAFEKGRGLGKFFNRLIPDLSLPNSKSASLLPLLLAIPASLPIVSQILKDRQTTTVRKRLSMISDRVNVPLARHLTSLPPFPWNFPETMRHSSETRSALSGTPAAASETVAVQGEKNAVEGWHIGGRNRNNTGML
jgi:hypothetical protein